MKSVSRAASACLSPDLPVYRRRKGPAGCLLSFLLSPLWLLRLQPLGCAEGVIETADPLPEFEVTACRVGPVLDAVHFGANCEYHRPGLFFGTLPQSDPRSKRTKFAAALEKSGIRSLRFPGGNCSYWYLYDSEAATRRLTQALSLHQYHPDKFYNQYFTPLENFLAFCEEQNIEAVLQLPTMFYNDTGHPRAVLPCRHVKRAPQLYDRDRVDEAAAYIRGLVRWTRKHGFRVRHWEIGNEEFAHYDVERYVRILDAFLPGIREECPDAQVYAPMQRWAQELLPLLDACGFQPSDLVLTTHYPFGSWFLPPAEVDTRDPANYVLADMKFERNFSSAGALLDELGWGETRIGVTETSVIRFPHEGEHSWDMFAVTPSLAHALAFTWNWGVLISRPDCSLATFHDLESTFFGLMKYDVSYSREEKRFSWIPPDVSLPPDGASTDSWFKGRYVLTPSAHAMGMLSNLEGCELLEIAPAGLSSSSQETILEGSEFRALAGIQGASRLIVIAVNRCSENFHVRFRFHSSLPRIEKFQVRILKGTAEKAMATLRAVLPAELSVEESEVPGPFPEVVIPAFSVLELTGNRSD